MFGGRRRMSWVLTADRDPVNPPAPTRLVPMSREDFVRQVEREGGRLIVPPPPPATPGLGRPEVSG